MALNVDVSLLLLVLSWFDSHLTDAAEYCWESFNVTCREDEVILMMTANYGRMKFGRCLPRDYFVGCAADILPYMDRKCSGRRACALDVPDTELHNMQPCPKDLLAYLEATHTCVKVAQASFAKSCRPANQLSIKSIGFLSSIVTSATGQGSSACPWIMTVSSGQRINITLLDFAVNVGHSQTSSSSSSSSSSSNVCVMYGILREFVGDAHSEVTICGGGHRREKPVYLSERNRLVVELVQSVTQLDKSYFLLRYEAVGCSDLKAPPNGWVERQGDRATVYCNQSSDVWHLVCSTDTWIGTYHNCSSGSLAVARDSGAIGPPSYPFGVFVAVTIGIAIGVLSGLLLLSVVICCQRRKRFRLCFSSCYGVDDSGIWSHADDLAVNGDLEKTRVLLAEKFCYDLIGRRWGGGGGVGGGGEFPCPAAAAAARCGDERCGCGGGGGPAVSFPVVVAAAAVPASSPAGQCYQLQRQMEQHRRCYERANFVTMTTTTTTSNGVGLPPDIQFGLADRRIRSEEEEEGRLGEEEEGEEEKEEDGNEGLETGEYFTSVELR